MNHLQQIESMSKDQIRQMLAQQTERFQTVYGGEVVLHAPKDPNPKPLLSPASKPGRKRLPNEKQAEWEKYLSQVANGTYVPEKEPEVQYKTPKKQSVRLPEYF